MKPFVTAEFACHNDSRGKGGGLKREREYSVMYGKIVGGVEVAKYFCLIYSLEPLYYVGRDLVVDRSGGNMSWVRAVMCGCSALRIERGFQMNR